MTTIEVNAKVAEAIEHLMLAQPGRPAEVRKTHRQAAGEILGSLKASDLRKVDDTLVAVLGDLS